MHYVKQKGEPLTEVEVLVQVTRLAVAKEEHRGRVLAVVADLGRIPGDGLLCARGPHVALLGRGDRGVVHLEDVRVHGRRDACRRGHGGARVHGRSGDGGGRHGKGEGGKEGSDAGGEHGCWLFGGGVR